MINWPLINAALRHWLIGMILVVAWLMMANAGCSISDCGETTASGLSLAGLGGIVFFGARAMVMLMRAETRLLFSPLVAYAAASALFFGFGPMSTFLASELTQLFQNYSVYALTAREVLRTALLSSTGIAISVAVILMVLPNRSQKFTPRPVLSIRTVTLFFLVVGLALKHLLIMPSIYGTSNFPLPGMLRNLRYLPDLGFALTAMLAARGDRGWQVLFWAIWPWHLLLAFPEFSKKSVMLTILLPALGAYAGHQSLKRLAVWVVGAMMLFTSLQNINAISRWEVTEAEEYREVLSVRDRFRILIDSGVSTVDVEHYLPEAKIGVETWWLRLNFSGPQAAAMALYDEGISSIFTQNILVYLVPRILWPDKPTLVSPGQQFHATVTGNANTNTRVGITVFADGYWKIGWFGVALWSGIVGLVFAVITRLTLAHLAQGRYLYMPAAMLGLQMGATSTTAFLQNAILSGLPVYFGFCLVVYLTYRILNASAKSKRRHARMGPVRGHARV